MNNKEIADRLEELLIIAKNTGYMWYYDEYNVHKGLIALSITIRNQEPCCRYCEQGLGDIGEIPTHCPKCNEYIVYDELLEKEQ